MKQETKSLYIILFILVLIFFTKDCNYFREFYKNIQEVKEPDSFLVLVNKNRKLPNTYIPNDLKALDINFSLEEKYVREEVKVAFEQLARHASSEGYDIVAVSAFRPFSYQDNLYHSYVEQKGITYADRCSARPGHSEHQTGLAIDVMGENKDYDRFVETKEFKWMKEHAHQYGFILRYPEEKEAVTGFKFEPWHYRYVGIQAATEIKNTNLSLEEYVH